MSYVAAGYAIALGVLALYALSLLVRTRRLERAARRAEAEGPEPVPSSPDAAPSSTGPAHRARRR